MTYHRPADRFTKRAKKEGFAARSVYKLEEIDRRTQLLKQGLRVLDLGAAPGSWTQYAAPKVGPRGRIVALDLEPLRVPVPAQVTALQRDVFEGAPEAFRELGEFDVVLSDMAPHTTGVRHADAARSEELAMRAVELAGAVLVPGGKMVVKIFQGGGFEEVRNKMREFFETIRVIKPEATRTESVELFLVGINRK